MPKTKWMMIAAIIGVLVVGGVLLGPVMSRVETPKYDVVQVDQNTQSPQQVLHPADETAEKNIEIRQYKAMVIAEVDVAGKRQDAIGEGFRVLAKYIFGHNAVQQGVAMTAPVQQQISQNIAMTAPVQQQISQTNQINQTIAMTAPVQQQLTQQSWKISFVMPAQYNITSLPKSLDHRVVLREIAPKRFVVIQFSGINSDENIKHHEQCLLNYIEKNRLTVLGSPTYAFYNPPWTLPAMRRNEVMFELVQ